MVVTLLAPAREWFGLKELITVRHLENMNKIILVTGSIVGFAYGTECFNPSPMGAGGWIWPTSKAPSCH